VPESCKQASGGAGEVTGEYNREAFAKAAVDAGLAALGGEKGMTYDALVYAAANILWHLGKYDTIAAAAGFVRDVLDSGEALKRFNAAA
jgi:anthranilate phosphoribosyltransferase